MTWITPGEDAALEGLTGPKGFLNLRVKGYGEDRNDPAKGPTSLSGLSPWLHYGQISAQRCALEARKLRSKYAKVQALWWCTMAVCWYLGDPVTLSDMLALVHFRCRVAACHKSQAANVCPLPLQGCGMSQVTSS